jgi:alkaline phosphatase
MKKNRTLKLVLFLILSSSIQINSFSQATEEIKNIILLIGDGMGTDQVYAAISTSNNKLNLERAKYIGFSKTYSANNYITDSGAGGTAISSGIKTNNYSVGVDTSGNSCKSILVYAEEHNKSTGLVTTCDLTHATPASFVAHNKSRHESNDIALDFLDVEVDVLIGGGKHRFDSLGITGSLIDKGYKVTDKLSSIIEKDEIPLACFVSSKHPKSIIEGRDPDYLKDAVEIALKKLSKNREGFFLMVEGSQIDWGGHANDLNFVISETIDFDRAVGAAFDFADKNPGTLVVATADHETGGLTIVGGDLDSNKISGHFSTSGHSSVMVPIFAYGAGAENFSHIMENTDIFKKMMKAFGFND